MQVSQRMGQKMNCLGGEQCEQHHLCLQQTFINLIIYSLHMYFMSVTMLGTKMAVTTTDLWVHSLLGEAVDKP
jgi:hypothetical protein